jgi:hypothetical protein
MGTYRAIRDWSDLPGGSPSEASETYELDFKAEHETDGGEQAKDMAAFANAFGGVILIGVAEKADTFTRKLLSIGEAEIVAKDYENAARELLSPRPLVDPSIIRLPEDESRALVAVNVDPFPGQLVGARLPQTQAWRFPVRTAARHCTYLDPEKQMIYSDPRTRKAAILLSSIEPTSKKIFVQVMERREADQQFSNRDRIYEGEFRGLDVHKNSVSLAVRLDDQIMPIAVPLEDVQAVWTGGGLWTVRLDGAIRFQKFGKGSWSIFYISGRGPYE